MRGAIRTPGAKKDLGCTLSALTTPFTSVEVRAGSAICVGPASPDHVREVIVRQSPRLSKSVTSRVVGAVAAVLVTFALLDSVSSLFQSAHAVQTAKSEAGRALVASVR